VYHPVQVDTGEHTWNTVIILAVSNPGNYDSRFLFFFLALLVLLLGSYLLLLALVLASWLFLSLIPNNLKETPAKPLRHVAS
jgi:hypothetical protein